MIPIRRKDPLLPGTPDYSRAFYCDPPSHDACVWLIIAELMRRHHKAAGPLKVRFGFINGQLGAYDFGPLGILSGQAYPCGYSRQYSDRMLGHVIRPAMEMIGAIEEESIDAPFDPASLAGYCEYDYHVGHLVDAGRQGHKIPQWQIPQWAHDEVAAMLGKTRPIVITLREAEHQPERNSNVREWLAFASAIQDEYPVLFVRDTAYADAPLPFATCPRASRNAYIRAALYSRAFCNLMTQNGPCVWVFFSDSPYLVLKQLVPALPNWAHGNATGWRDQDHMEVGDQYPWASPLQRLTWTDDTFENITAAFNDFRKRDLAMKHAERKGKALNGDMQRLVFGSVAA